MRYTWYENYPNNRIIVNGVDLSTTYRMVLADGYSLGVPEAKTYTVDIPGGDGVIDLTESLVGDTLYNNRTQEFTFYIIDQQNQEDFEDVKTAVSNFLHGKAYDYVLTFDPEYIYHGRFHVSAYEHQAFPSGILGAIKITIDADPYKTKGTMSYTLNATGGKQYEFTSGRKKVHPILTCSEPCKVNFNGTSLTVPKGTYRLNPVIFEEGVNELYLNSHRVQTLTWSDIGKGGMFAMLWGTPTVTSSTVEYASSTTGTSVPSSWSSSYPSSGTYIWTRVTTKYSDGTKTYSYTVDYTSWEDNGEYNEGYVLDSDYEYILDSDGNYVFDSNTIVSLEAETYYASTDSGTTIPADTAWLYADLVGAWLDVDSEQFSYVYSYEDDDYLVFLWLRIETLYSDNTSTLVYQVTQESTYGDDCTSVIRYQASSSGTEVPDGTWSSTYPSTTDYPYIWTRIVRTYTSTAYVTTSYDVEYLYVSDTISATSIEHSYSYYIITDESYITDSDGDYVLDSDGGYFVDPYFSISIEFDMADYVDAISEWSDTRPEIDDSYNYIILIRDVTTYSDGGQNIDYSADVYIGYDLSLTESYYIDSTSGVDIPDESEDWLDDSDDIGEEAYSWTKRIYTYGNDYVVTMYDSTYNTAEATIDAIYAVNTDTKYQYSSDPDTLTAMTTGRFEWVKTYTEYSDGGATTEYECTYNAESLGADQLRWDEIHLLYDGMEAYKRTWSDISNRTWNDISGHGSYSITWDSLDYKDVDFPDIYVTLEYDWKDL